MVRRAPMRNIAVHDCSACIALNAMVANVPLPEDEPFWLRYGLGGAAAPSGWSSFRVTDSIPRGVRDFLAFRHPIRSGPKSRRRKTLHNQ